MGIVGLCMGTPFAIIVGGGHYLIYEGGISFEVPKILKNAQFMLISIAKGKFPTSLPGREGGSGNSECWRSI